MDQQLELTPNEVGFVLGKSGQDVNRAVDKGVVKARTRRRNGTKRRLLGQAEVRYLRLLEDISDDLSTSARAKLYAAIRKAPLRQKIIRLGIMSFDIASIDKAIKDRIKALERSKRMVRLRARDGEPLLRGTEIPVYLLAALADGGASIKEILEDFPSLTEEQVRAALSYAAVYPKKGRPYPGRSLKRMLADLDLGAVELEREDGPPREIRV